MAGRTEVLYGVHACKAALARGARILKSVHIQTGIKKRPPAWLLEHCERLGVPVTRHRRDHSMERLVGPDTVHQGVALEVSPLSPRRIPRESRLVTSHLPSTHAAEPSFQWAVQRRPRPNQPPAAPTAATNAQPLPWEPWQHSWRSNTPPLILALEHVEDVQNLGALLRSALFLGADGVLLSAHNTAPVSPACAKASAGASEVWLASGRLLSAGRFADTLAESAAAGWAVLGAAAHAPAAAAAPNHTGPSTVADDHATSTDSLASSASVPPTVLVLGNEGTGLTDETRRACTGFVGVADRQQPWAWEADSGSDVRSTGAEFFVDSLNVGSAGAVLLNECARRKHAVLTNDRT